MVRFTHPHKISKIELHKPDTNVALKLSRVVSRRAAWSGAIPMNELELFIESLRRADPAERAAYLDQVCNGDATLRQRLERLLAIHAAAGESLEEPGPESATGDADAATDEPGAPPSTDGAGDAPRAETKLLSTPEPFDPDETADWSSSGGSGQPPLVVAGLDEFELLDVLGRGGMGVVYKARHRPLNRIVALKMIGDDKHASPEHRERFLIEARAVARLQHANIVQIYDIGDADGRPFVTLEMLEGGSLAGRLKGTVQSGRAAAELLATLALAMHAAHRAGIIHRDLKPSNILFDKTGLPKIVDFGLAKQLDVAEGYTLSGQVMGTPSYMAPEQAQGKTPEIGPAADIYGLGAVLYEMLTGRPPFKGSSVLATLHHVVHDDVVPPSRMQPGIARDLETICLKCLQKEPARRYATALELAEDLERYLGNRPIRARRTPLWERGAKWVRRHPTAATLIGLGTAAAALLILAILSYNAADRRALARRQDEAERVLDRIETRLPGKDKDRDWADVRYELGKLLTDLKGEPRLASLSSRAQRRLDQADRVRLAESTARRNSAEHRRFLVLRNEAFLHETRFTGLDLPADVQATRTAARAALAVAATPVGDDRWTFVPPADSLTETEQAEIVDGRYELLLVLADAVAQPMAGAGEDPAAQAGLALGILDQAARLRPRLTRTYHRARADCLVRRGDQAGAAAERAAADKLPPATVLDHFLAGREGYRRGDWKTALQEFDTVVRMQPGHFWALCLGAIAAVQSNAPAMAKLGLSACIEREPNFAWLYLLRGYAAAQAAVQARVASQTLLVKDGSIEAAAEVQFEAAEADAARALELLEKKPNDELRWAVLLNRALARFQRGRLDASVADFQEAIRLDARHSVAFDNLALVLLAQRKWDEADAQFTRAIALKPDWARLYRDRALVQEVRDDQMPAHRAAALRDLEEAIRLETPGDPLQARDHARQSDLLRRDRRFAEALGACDAALKIAPDLDTAHRLRVWLLLDLGRPGEVIASCDGALAKGKPWPDLYEVRGMARAQRRDYLGAIDDYSAALLFRPGRPRVLTSRGKAYLVVDSLRPALRDFDEALRLDPASGEAQSGRGLALALLGDHRGATAAADQSLRDDPVPAERYYHAARIYAQAAIAAANEVTRNGPVAVTLVDRYQDHAVLLVKRALEATPPGRRASFWQDLVAADPALRTLQRRLRPLQPAGAGNRPVTSGPGTSVSALRLR
jgi:tetratricopeptide (TPR) repeat protein/tRNA A-37 threonylcarbamoyl transferase component Bud32